MSPPADDAGGPGTGESEDLIGSSPDRLDRLADLVSARVPRSFSRTAMVATAALAAVAGLVLGQLTAPRSAGPVDSVASTSSSYDRGSPAAALPREFAALGRGLMTADELAAIGEPVTGGTYTRGSASAIPDPCSRPRPGDTGVSYVPGPSGATAVSFQVAGGTVTERVTTFVDDQAARQHLRDVVVGVSICQSAVGTGVSFGEIGAGLGHEYVAGTVVRRYPTGSTTTAALLVVRVGSVLVEFSLTGSTAAAADFAVRCRAIALAGLAR